MMNSRAWAIGVLSCLLLVGGVALSQDRADRKGGRPGAARGGRDRKEGERPAAGRGQEGNRPDMRKMMEERREAHIKMLRRMLNVKTDEEWEIIKGKIEAVEKLRESLARLDQVGNMLMGMSMRKKMAREAEGEQRGAQGDERMKRRTEMFDERIKEVTEGQPVLEPVVAALRSLTELLSEETAMNEELKEKLAAYRKARDAAGAELTKRRTELRQILDVRQESILVISGILD